MKPAITESVLFAQNIREETVLHVACRHGNLEILKLVAMKMSISSNSLNADQFFYHKNYQGQTCFHLACSFGFVNIVLYFLEDLKMLAFVDILNNGSNTPLHLAASNGHSSIVSVLLSHISSLSVRNEDNNTALELSCRQGHFDISKILIEHIPSVEADKAISSDFPLHVACNEGADEIVKLLLQKVRRSIIHFESF
jgi:ankyrin repeat protein